MKIRFIGPFVLMVTTSLLAETRGCGSGLAVAKDCGLLFQGIYVRAGEVREVVWPTCNEMPEQHVLHAWMEYKTLNEDYTPLGRRQAVSRARPDREGFPVNVSAGICVEGWYRTTVHVQGYGPADPQHPGDIPFDYTETGYQTHISAQECDA